MPLRLKLSICLARKQQGEKEEKTTEGKKSLSLTLTHSQIEAAAVNQRERGQTGEVAAESLLGFFSLVTPHKPELVIFVSFTN